MTGSLEKPKQPGLRVKLQRAGCCLILGTFLLSWSPGCSAGHETLARVNNKDISRHELDTFINLMRLCNPDLDLTLQGEPEGPRRRQMELEFLQILIDIELVRQETARHSLSPDPTLVELKTGEMLQSLAAAHYGGSLEQLHRRREQLKLPGEALSLIPRYELQLQALFDRMAAAITGEDLLLFVEENPELLRREAALELYRISFTEETAARRSLEKLRQGVPVEELVRQLRGQYPALQAETLGWVAESDPFIEEPVRVRMFNLNRGEQGAIIETGNRFDLYWVKDFRPAANLHFEDIKEEAMLRKQYILYQDYFNSLWSEGRIEILYN